MLTFTRPNFSKRPQQWPSDQHGLYFGLRQEFEADTLAEKETHMGNASYLCRFRSGEEPAQLGLVRGRSLYDLSCTGRPEFASLSAWLQHVDEHGAGAFSELSSTIEGLTPLCEVDDVSSTEHDIRLLAPLDAQEVWACGVTYRMSREARMRESQSPTIYGRVYEAERPEVFFKATPHRVVGPNEPVGIREDSTWDVPEPELTLVVTPGLRIAGYTVGNDMSSRDIEGQNPLYLPQAKVYDRCCALGPWIRLADEDVDPLNLAMHCCVRRGGLMAFEGHTLTSNLSRTPQALVRAVGRCNRFPAGLFVMTGTGIVPPDSFTLAEGDLVEITIEGIGTLSNPVMLIPAD